jgi:HAD superfamily hydrolase (TIGR01549 family)
LIKAIIFDLVRTLGEFKHLVNEEEASSLLRELGYKVYPQAWKYSFGFVLFVDYPRIGYESVEDIIGQTLKHLDINVEEETLSKVAEIYRRNTFKLYSNSVEALKKAKNCGFKTAVATSTPKPFFDEALRLINPFIDYLCTGYEAGCEKSNPRMLHHALEKLGVKPSEAVMVGDDPKLDILNAKRVGLKTIQVGSDNLSGNLADTYVRDVLEAVNLVQSWNSTLNNKMG